MFEGLKTLKILKHGMVIDGPNIGKAYYSDLDFIVAPDCRDEPVTPSMVGDSSPPDVALTVREITYHKFIYSRNNMGVRHYVWTVNKIPQRDR